jgi:small ligand-binding sensory domain FIST
MITHPLRTTHSATLQFASALSRNADTEAATRDVADAVCQQIGENSVDLAFVFFSAHHAAQATVISTMLQDALRAEVCVGCSGEGVIGGSEELETAPALTLWVAHLPGVQVTPLRLSFSDVQDQVQLTG